MASVMHGMKTQPFGLKMADGTVSRMVEVAMAEVGYVEGPKDNETKYNEAILDDAMDEAEELPY